MYQLVIFRLAFRLLNKKMHSEDEYTSGCWKLHSSGTNITLDPPRAARMVPKFCQPTTCKLYACHVPSSPPPVIARSRAPIAQNPTCFLVTFLVNPRCSYAQGEGHLVGGKFPLRPPTQEKISPTGTGARTVTPRQSKIKRGKGTTAGESRLESPTSLRPENNEEREIKDSYSGHGNAAQSETRRVNCGAQQQPEHMTHGKKGGDGGPVYDYVDGDKEDHTVATQGLCRMYKRAIAIDRFLDAEDRKATPQRRPYTGAPSHGQQALLQGDRVLGRKCQSRDSACVYAATFSALPGPFALDGGACPYPTKEVGFRNNATATSKNNDIDGVVAGSGRATPPPKQPALVRRLKITLQELNNVNAG